MTDDKLKEIWKELALIGCNQKCTERLFLNACHRVMKKKPIKEKTLFEKHKIKKSEVEKFTALQQLENITKGEGK